MQVGVSKHSTFGDDRAHDPRQQTHCYGLHQCYPRAAGNRIAPTNVMTEYVITLHYINGNVFRVIDNGNQLSPNPNCFTINNKDGKLEYIEIVRFKETVNFTELETGKELTKHRISLKYIDEDLYLMK